MSCNTSDICTLNSIAEITFNLFEFISNNATSKTNGFEDSNIREFNKSNIELVESIGKNEVNILNRYGKFKCNEALIKDFAFIIQPLVIKGQIKNIPKLTDFELCINHSLILLDIISPNNIKWHTHKSDQLYFCWSFEPDYNTHQTIIIEEDIIKSDINYIKTLYYSITNNINYIDNSNHIFYIISGLLTWSLISLYEHYSRDDIRLFKSDNQYKIDICGNIVNIAMESCMIYPVCSSYPKLNNITSNWHYFKYIFLNTYNNKIYSNPLSKNIQFFIINLISKSYHNVTKYNQTHLIPVLLRLLNSDQKEVKSSCYEYIIKYLTNKELDERHISIILKYMRNSFPTSESQISLLDGFIDCYIALLSSITNKELIYDCISTIINNLWNIRNIYNLRIKVLIIYLKLIESWKMESYIHLEKILTLIFNILEPDTNSIIYEDISQGLDSLIKLLEAYKGYVKHYCYDIYYRIWNLYVIFKYESKIVRDDLLDKIKQIIILCNKYFNDYCIKCINQLKLEVNNIDQSPLFIEHITI